MSEPQVAPRPQMDDLWRVATRVGGLLVRRDATVAVAESSTGGLISAALLAVPGASAYFRGGGVVYTKIARSFLLRIGADALRDVRPSTTSYARLLAATARDGLATDWAVGETGAAGPSGNAYGDPPGHCCFAVAGQVELVGTLESGSSDRLTNMAGFAIAALQLLERALD